MSRENNNGTEIQRETPSLALGKCEFHQLFLENNRNLMSREARKLLFSLVEREERDIMLSWCVAITIFGIVCFDLECVFKKTLNLRLF